ncbi:hypothetical protein [Acinetobacter sp. SA01]|uniref:hypothetical protein n=1 Tax=Acinetobacter sp. SA01 TaxID=1862567 RepID=UPI001409AD66|nr:hypothetical protein [Acinetobacter sp. SA01]
MATLATNVSFQCFGPDGKPLAGGKVYSYAAGTTTNKATYTTMAGTVANPNPITLDQNGKAKIFLGDGAYRLRILDSNDALVDDIDQISRYVTQSEFTSFQQTVNDGVAQLTEVREQIDVYVNASIGDQKGFANGIAPLNENVKVDPIYLPTLPNTAIPKATETALGVVELATQDEVNTGTDDERAVTPKKLLAGVKNHLNATGNAPTYACRAWVNFNGTGTPTIRASGNVSSITDNGVGQYTINFTTAMQDVNYAPLISIILPSVGNGTPVFYTPSVLTTSSLSIVTGIRDAGASSYGDYANIFVGIIR